MCEQFLGWVAMNLSSLYKSHSSGDNCKDRIGATLQYLLKKEEVVVSLTLEHCSCH